VKVTLLIFFIFYLKLKTLNTLTIENSERLSIMWKIDWQARCCKYCLNNHL
jgi:hypothetical protein